MITWVSLRSGMASRGVFNNAQYPQMTRNVTNRKMMNLLRALYSMILAIITILTCSLRFAPHGQGCNALQLRCGVDQEIGRGGDLLSRPDAGRYLHPAVR